MRFRENFDQPAGYQYQEGTVFTGESFIDEYPVPVQDPDYVASSDYAQTDGNGHLASNPGPVVVHDSGKHFAGFRLAVRGEDDAADWWRFGPALPASGFARLTVHYQSGAAVHFAWSTSEGLQLRIPIFNNVGYAENPHTTLQLTPVGSVPGSVGVRFRTGEWDRGDGTLREYLLLDLDVDGTETVGVSMNAFNDPYYPRGTITNFTGGALYAGSTGYPYNVDGWIRDYIPAGDQIDNGDGTITSSTGTRYPFLNWMETWVAWGPRSVTPRLHQNRSDFLAAGGAWRYGGGAPTRQSSLWQTAML